MVVQHKGRKFRVSTGHIVKPIAHWNKKDQRVKLSFEDYKTINSELESLEGHIKSVISNYKIVNHTVPSLEYVKNQINIDPNAEKDKTFPRLMQKFLERSKADNKASTYRDYKKFEASITKFQKEERLTITFENINADTIERYKKFLRKSNNSPYTVKKKLYHFKLFLNYGVKNHYIPSYNQSLFDFKASVNKGDKVYITNKELERLEKLKD